MPARVIRLHTPPHVRLLRALRIAWLRRRVAWAREDIRHEESSLWPRTKQIAAWRSDIGAWEVEILMLENA